MKTTTEKILKKDRTSQYYADAARARWDREREGRITKIARVFTKVMDKNPEKPTMEKAHELAQLVVLKKLK